MLVTSSGLLSVAALLSVTSSVSAYSDLYVNFPGQLVARKFELAEQYYNLFVARGNEHKVHEGVDKLHGEHKEHKRDNKEDNEESQKKGKESEKDKKKTKKHKKHNMEKEETLKLEEDQKNSHHKEHHGKEHHGKKHHEKEHHGKKHHEKEHHGKEHHGRQQLAQQPQQLFMTQPQQRAAVEANGQTSRPASSRPEDKEIPHTHISALKAYQKDGEHSKGNYHVLCFANGEARSWAFKDGEVVAGKYRGASHLTHGDDPKKPAADATKKDDKDEKPAAATDDAAMITTVDKAKAATGENKPAAAKPADDKKAVADPHAADGHPPVCIAFKMDDEQAGPEPGQSVTTTDKNAGAVAKEADDKKPKTDSKVVPVQHVLQRGHHNSSFDGLLPRQVDLSGSTVYFD
ncbi:hypothetical protein K437DRAFT_258453 [Tilletiaria anomala UBC 951]|uniref:Uncharacterized protein n=1 Tax=Tilletiaria anomala (strain ATCC 24038 / CBS 436.72 / UBC 951) TaxID=1037660 RepID=A0A066VQ93_TILAU|nr:uncharacterized protein K437DRAFT_258453 [Tilletiaria anomala UBC 951]KDN40954.1 hypothetical protein K437DRAFT_258453 [Tilletiaria anomala UBC 951]